jgi:rhodanese-related sulfurtransferase
MARRVTPREAKDLLDQGYVYLDVRSTPEFERGHPRGAVSIPLLEAGPQGMQPNPDFVETARASFSLDAKLVVGCEAGARSARAVAALEEAGFTGLADQYAGFGGAKDSSGRRVEAGWRDCGLPVATGK